MGALDRVFRSRRPSQLRPLAAIIAGLWRNGEQGVEFDASDLTTMFQDAAGTTPVYAPGQGQVDPPVGLWLDKRLGRARGPDVFSDAAVTFLGESARISAGVYRVYSSAGVYSGVNIPIAPHAWYELSFNVDSIAVLGGGLTIESAINPGVTSAGRKTFFIFSTIGAIVIKRASSAVDVQISGLSLKRFFGNHAYQVSTPSRPVLSARYNALSASERFDDAYWGFTSNYAVEKTGDVQDPSGGSNAWKITSTTGSAALNKVVGAGFKNPVYTVILRAGSRNPDILVRNATTTTNLVGGSTSSPSTSGTYGKFTNADLGGGWRKLTIEITSGVATSDVLIIYLGSTGSVATGQYFYAYRAEFREGNDGVGLPEYQRVVDPNTYDTAGFPPYLKFDGVDDWLQTANIDFSGTGKVDIFTAVRKLTDASRGVIIELGPNGYGQPDSFNQEQAWFSPNFSGSYSGSAGSATLTKAGVAAPLSAVLSTLYDKSGSLARLRYNGQLASSSTSNVGAGVFLNAPLFIGRRGGSSSASAMRIYGGIVRGASTPDATVPKVERYLNSKARIY